MAFNIDFDNDPLLLFAGKPLDYTEKKEGWAIFPKTIPAESQHYNLKTIKNGEAQSLATIRGEEFNIYNIQMLPDEQILLICPRSYYSSPDDFEKNGRIYSLDGKLKKEILLGDGIQDVQATKSGTIWTSFFDEGIFGNYGWRNPIGASGLIAFDVNGKILYEFEPVSGLDHMVDCYAINVPSDHETWCYYYTDFPIVKIRDRKIEDFWHSPVTGAGAFSIYNDLVLFVGSYDNKAEFQIVKLLENHKSKIICKINLTDEKGNPLEPERVAARSSHVLVISGTRVYKIDLQDIAAQL